MYQRPDAGAIRRLRFTPGIKYRISGERRKIVLRPNAISRQQKPRRRGDIPDRLRGDVRGRGDGGSYRARPANAAVNDRRFNDVLFLARRGIFLGDRLASGDGRARFDDFGDRRARLRRFGRLGRLFARLYNGDVLRLGVAIRIIDAGEIDGRNSRLNRASSGRADATEDLSVSLRRADGKEKRRCKVD